MRRSFYELVTKFAQQNGCVCALKEGQCQTSLMVAELEIQLGLIETSGMLIIQTGVGVLPDEHREAFLQDLLVANNLFSRTLGMTLGVDTELELVTLQLAWELANLDDIRFENLMSSVLAQAAEWLHKLDTWEVSTTQTNDAEIVMDVNSSTFLRV